MTDSLDSVPREREGLVRLIVESFRDAPRPSVDIAVEEIMRTFESPPDSGVPTMTPAANLPSPIYKADILRSVAPVETAPKARRSFEVDDEGYDEPEPSVPVISDQTIERLVDGYAVAFSDSDRAFPCRHDLYDKSAAVRSALIKFIGDRMLTPHQADALLDLPNLEMFIGPNLSPPIIAALRLRSNDAL